MRNHQRTAISMLRVRLWAFGLLSGLTAAGAGCSPVGPDNNKLPPNVQDPATLHNPAGALELYRAALLTLPKAFDQAMLQGAILTDELAALPLPPGAGGSYINVDSRQHAGGTGSDAVYGLLHRTRAQLREARGFLDAYAPDSSPALRGHLYAVEGYADVLLADLFCSPIPLSTVDFQGDYTLAAGSKTSEVYQQALTLFDSALALTADRADFQRLAAIGRSRALLALGIYDSAALAVAAVPTDYSYQITSPYPWSMAYFASDADPTTPTSYATAPGVPGVGQNEGQNGLAYLDDPRAGGNLLGAGLFGGTYYFPRKYDPFSQTVQYVVASGVEARLIEAEAALQGQFSGGGDWLTILNTLRTDGTFEERTTDPNDPAATYTFWHHGTGGVDSLAPLDDPGTPEGRVDLLFRERAFWLYLTAHREGDLRRLVRLYERDPEAVYPTGNSYAGGVGTYGSDIVFPVPDDERKLNPKYSGCNNYNA